MLSGRGLEIYLDFYPEYIQHLEAELAKFHECVESNGCYDKNGMPHDSSGGFQPMHNRFTEGILPVSPRKVYHKEGE